MFIIVIVVVINMFCLVASPQVGTVMTVGQVFSGKESRNEKSQPMKSCIKCP